MLESGADPESYITECALVYEDYLKAEARIWPGLSFMCRIRSAAFSSQLAAFEKECLGDVPGPPLGQVRFRAKRENLLSTFTRKEEVTSSFL